MMPSEGAQVGQHVTLNPAEHHDLPPEAFDTVYVIEEVMGAGDDAFCLLTDPSGEPLRFGDGAQILRWVRATELEPAETALPDTKKPRVVDDDRDNPHQHQEPTRMSATAIGSAMKLNQRAMQFAATHNLTVAEAIRRLSREDPDVAAYVRETRPDPPVAALRPDPAPARPAPAQPMSLSRGAAALAGAVQRTAAATGLPADAALADRLLVNHFEGALHLRADPGETFSRFVARVAQQHGLSAKDATRRCAQAAPELASQWSSGRF